MEYEVGIGGSIASASGFGVIREAVAIPPEQRAPVLLLENESLGANPSAHVVDLSARETEGVDHAFAIDKDVSAVKRWVLAIGTASQQGSFDFRGQVALDQFQPANGGLDTIRVAPT